MDCKSSYLTPLDRTIILHLEAQPPLAGNGVLAACGDEAEEGGLWHEGLQRPAQQQPVSSRHVDIRWQEFFETSMLRSTSAVQRLLYKDPGLPLEVVSQRRALAHCKDASLWPWVRRR